MSALPRINSHFSDTAGESRPLTYGDAVARALNGEKPRNPDTDKDMLLAKGFIAQLFLRRLESFFAATFPESDYTIGPPKDMTRAEDKAEKNKDDLSSVCDIARAMSGLADLDQIERAIPLLNRRGFVTMTNANGESLRFCIADVEDSFSYPDDEKKPGYRTLDIKIIVPMLKDSYHICELQIIHKGAKQAYMESHEDMENERLGSRRAKTMSLTWSLLEESIAEGSGETTRRDTAYLDELFNEYADNATFSEAARRERQAKNIAIAHALGLDRLRKDGKISLPVTVANDIPHP